MYIGQTNNLDERLIRHNTNRVKSTKNKGPWKVIYSKSFVIRQKSVNHEAYLKSLKSPKYIRQFIVS